MRSAHLAATALVGLAFGIGAMVAEPVPVSAAAAAAKAPSATFAEGGTTAAWDGSLLTVKFRENGVKPWSSGAVSIRATGIVDVTCVGGPMQLSSQSSAATEVVTQHKADGTGVRRGEQAIVLSVQAPVIAGLPCRPTLSRTFTVTVQDLETGAVHTLTGSAV